MKVIKRNGAEVEFDIVKIIAAVTKANAATEEDARMTPVQIQRIAESVELACQGLGRAPTVEEIQDFVEHQIMAHGAFEVAKRYITYRYTRSLVRKSNTTDDKILTLIECNNEEAKQENSNKNPVVNSTQRDYMAGEVSRDLTNRILLPEDIVKAHEEGIIHFHDTDYYAQHMHNCDLVNLEDMLQNGTVITGTLIERPHSFATACNIATQIVAQVASNQYGGQSISLTHLAPLCGRFASEDPQAGACRDRGASASRRMRRRSPASWKKRLREEIRRGVQTIQYQVVTLLTTNGQAPFITVFMYLNEARSEQEKRDLALIIEEMLLQRYRGCEERAGACGSRPPSPSSSTRSRRTTSTRIRPTIISRSSPQNAPRAAWCPTTSAKRKCSSSRATCIPAWAAAASSRPTASPTRAWATSPTPATTSRASQSITAASIRAS